MSRNNSGFTFVETLIAFAFFIFVASTIYFLSHTPLLKVEERDGIEQFERVLYEAQMRAISRKRAMSVLLLTDSNEMKVFDPYTNESESYYLPESFRLSLHSPMKSIIILGNGHVSQFGTIRYEVEGKPIFFRLQFQKGRVRVEM